MTELPNNRVTHFYGDGCDPPHIETYRCLYIAVDEYQASLIRYALSRHIEYNGGSGGTSDDAHNRMVEACQAIIDELDTCFGPMALLG
jgi:hypothetical protein